MQPVAARQNLLLHISSPASHQQGKVKTAALSPHYCSEIPRERCWTSFKSKGESREEIKVLSLYPWSWMGFFPQYTSIQNKCFSCLLGSKPCHVAAYTGLGHMVNNAPWWETYHKNSAGRNILKTPLMGQKYPLEETDHESTYWACYLVATGKCSCCANQKVDFFLWKH